MYVRLVLAKIQILIGHNLGYCSYDNDSTQRQVR